MSFENPRRSLHLPNMVINQSDRKLQSNRRSFPQLPKPKTKLHRPRKTPCYDWIFSSATNNHIAIDKFWFKTFTPFNTYVLTVADQKQIPVRGIGSVDIKIRCKPNSHQSRVISLDSVLYVPSWVCNVFSDRYFDVNSHNQDFFEHKWMEQGVCFTKRTSGRAKYWGYTENFCGLDRLVLSRKPHGRSPMLEDPEREVWSISLHWPHSQYERWQQVEAKEQQRLAKEHEAEVLSQQRRNGQALTSSTELLIPQNTNSDTPNPKLKSPLPVSPSQVSVRSHVGHNLAKVIARQVNAASLDLHEAGARLSLNEICSNRAVPTRNDSKGRVSSLKATLNANRGLLKEFLAVQDRGFGEKKENRA